MRQRFNYIQRRVMLEANESGMKQKEIAGRVKASQPTVSQAIKQSRFERRIEELSDKNTILVGILSDMLNEIGQQFTRVPSNLKQTLYRRIEN